MAIAEAFRATKDAVRMLWDEFKPSATLIEDKANGSAVIEELSREVPGVLAINPEGGKVARAWAAQPTVEAGGMFLPSAAEHQAIQVVDDDTHVDAVGYVELRHLVVSAVDEDRVRAQESSTSLFAGQRRRY